MNRQNFPVYFLIGLILAFLLSVNNFAQKNYYPVEGDSWEHRTPEQAKIDGAKLKEAIDFEYQMLDFQLVYCREKYLLDNFPPPNCRRACR